MWDLKSPTKLLLAPPFSAPARGVRSGVLNILAVVVLTELSSSSQLLVLFLAGDLWVIVELPPSSTESASGDAGVALLPVVLGVLGTEPEAEAIAAASVWCKTQTSMKRLQLLIRLAWALAKAHVVL